MQTITASNVGDAAVKYLEYLLERPQRRETLLEIQDCRLTLPILAPFFIFQLPVEIREVSDILTDASIPEGFRYRYERSLINHYKPNGLIDWQYSHITRSEIDSLRELFGRDRGTDKCIMSFWYGPRDTVEICRRTREEKNDITKPRSPCGLTWHFRACRGGFQANILNRSIWYNTSFHADIFLPLEVGRYITQSVPKSYSAYVLNSKLKFRSNTDIEHTKLMLEWLKEGDKHLKILECFKPYDVWAENEFDLKEDIESLARAGDFAMAKKLVNQLQSNIAKDWALSMLSAEYMQQRIHRDILLNEWGVNAKNRLLTVSAKTHPYKSAVEPILESSSKGQFPYLQARSMMKRLVRYRFDLEIEKLMEVYDKPIQRTMLLYAVDAGSLKKDNRKHWKKLCRRFGVTLDLIPW